MCQIKQQNKEIAGIVGEEKDCEWNCELCKEINSRCPWSGQDIVNDSAA